GKVEGRKAPPGPGDGGRQPALLLDAESAGERREHRRDHHGPAISEGVSGPVRRTRTVSRKGTQARRNPRRDVRAKLPPAAARRYVQAHEVSLDHCVPDSRRPGRATLGPQGEHILEADSDFRRPTKVAWRRSQERRE